MIIWFVTIKDITILENAQGWVNFEGGFKESKAGEIASVQLEDFLQIPQNQSAAAERTEDF